MVFWSKSLVEDEMREWILECFDWFDDEFCTPDRLILPTEAFFGAKGGTDVETAKAVLNDVKRHMNCDVEVEILPLDVLPEEYRHDYQSMSQVAGTFQQIDDLSVIRYDPEQLKRPLQFINLMAHELMHVVLFDREDDIPGGEEAHELATDLGCIIFGFGIFQMQAADEAGWSGYLSQPSRAFALAEFLRQRNLGLDAVAPYLSGRCKKLVQRGIKEL